METSRFGLAIPLGTGLTIELVVDCNDGSAHAAVVDYYYEEVVRAQEMLAFADAVLGSYFMEPSNPSLQGDPVREYRVARGWTLEGWRNSLGRRVREAWLPAEELELILAA